ncbi:copper homeostasis protein CutC [Oscillibacter sp.]|uniref:copper homeostasis protein CutC n=1 Tax=Oscillibacter sp. TaxID=1945593 RepID=UPI002D7FB7CA|nr:copper homeostasis protein CutC [Oscillibacter sp.]
MDRKSIVAPETTVWRSYRTILTSGQTDSAPEGAETLGNLARQAAGRIEIMADCGVWKENIRSSHERSDVLTFHTTGRGAPLDIQEA